MQEIDQSNSPLYYSAIEIHHRYQQANRKHNPAILESQFVTAIENLTTEELRKLLQHLRTETTTTVEAQV